VACIYLTLYKKIGKDEVLKVCAKKLNNRWKFVQHKRTTKVIHRFSFSVAQYLPHALVFLCIS